MTLISLFHQMQKKKNKQSVESRTRVSEDVQEKVHHQDKVIEFANNPSDDALSTGKGK